MHDLSLSVAPCEPAPSDAVRRRQRGGMVFGGLQGRYLHADGHAVLPADEAGLGPADAAALWAAYAIGF